MQWRALDASRPVWIEDESRRIGRLVAPGGLWAQMQQAEVFVLDVPFEVRVERLVTAYGRYDTARLVEAIGAIGKRLGSLRAKQARQAVCDGVLYDACRLLLAYYDTAYRYHLEQRDTAKRRRVLLPASPTPDAFADQLLETTLV